MQVENRKQLFICAPFQSSTWRLLDSYGSGIGKMSFCPGEMAQLEFLFINVLKDSEYGIPNLERQIAESPMLFAQVVALVYKRRDDGEDPTEWRIENPEQRKTVALAAQQLSIFSIRYKNLCNR